MQNPTAALESAREAIAEFAIEGHLVDVVPYHRGHIHDTFISRFEEPFGTRRYLHQRLNDRVFRDLGCLMENIRVVTDHLERRQGTDTGSHCLHTLRLVRTRQGDSYLRHAHGNFRTYRYIENTETFDQCRGPEQAFEAARAFGRFQAMLSDLDSTRLRETIPDFFSSPHRLRQFDAARSSADPKRLAQSAREITFVEEHRCLIPRIAQRMADGVIPARIVHGDTKLNNVLFDKDHGRAISIVDLDTCMPGYSLYDFGDLVRFTAATSAEDERDTGRAGIDLALYRALVDGYLEGASHFLTPLEVEWMPFSAQLVTLTIGMRFLTDFLNGDVYFKIAEDRPEHNLERARVQFAMVARMESLTDAMRTK